MKYRLLLSEELSHLDEDLKHFLIVNGIHGEEWERINKEQPEKAIQLVEIFSDTVLQKVYEKITYLEFRSPGTCMVFFCTPENLKLISIQRKEGAELDLSSPESIHEALRTKIKELDFFRSEKPYSKDRESEIHQMLEQGCFISSSEFWNILNEVLK